MMHAPVAIPDWPVAAAASAGQTGSDEPAAVLGVSGTICANAWARRLGVWTGMRKCGALSIYPELVVVQCDACHDTLWFESVPQAVDTYVAHVAVVEPGRVIFPARGAVYAVGLVKTLIEALTGQIADVAGCGTHIGRGEGTPAALLATQSDIPPDVEGSAQFLKRTKVEGTLVGVVPSRRAEVRSCLELLATLGVRTVENLMGLGAAAVTSRFGEMGSLLWQLVRGRDVRLPAGATASSGTMCMRVFEPPLRNVGETVPSTRGLAEEPVQIMGARTAVSGRLRTGAIFDDGEELLRPWLVGGGDACDIADRVRWQLGEWAGGGLLARLELKLDAASADAAPEPLWGGRSAGNERTAAAVAQTQAVLGEESVRVPRKMGGRTAVRCHAEIIWGKYSLDGGRRPALPWPGAIPEPEPSRIHVAPVDIRLDGRCGHRLAVTEEAELTYAGGHADPGPGLLRSARGSVMIRDYAGPWPINERWWDPSGRSRRIYLQIVLDGVAALVYCEGGTQHEKGRYEWTPLRRSTGGREAFAFGVAVRRV